MCAVGAMRDLNVMRAVRAMCVMRAIHVMCSLPAMSVLPTEVPSLPWLRQGLGAVT